MEKVINSIPQYASDKLNFVCWPHYWSLKGRWYPRTPVKNLRFCKEAAFFNSLPSKFVFVTTILSHFEDPFHRKCGWKELGENLIHPNMNFNPFTPTRLSKRPLSPSHSRRQDVENIKSATSSWKDRNEGVLYYYLSRLERVKHFLFAGKVEIPAL